MKRALLAAVAGVSIGAGAVALSDQVHDWHDLDSVQNHIFDAIKELERANAANHYDTAGHAGRAERLLRDARAELALAVDSAKAGH